MKQFIVSSGSFPIATAFFLFESVENPITKTFDYKLVRGQNCPEAARQIRECVEVLQAKGILRMVHIYMDYLQNVNLHKTTGFILQDIFQHLVSVHGKGILCDHGNFFQDPDNPPGIVISPTVAAHLVESIPDVIVVRDMERPVYGEDFISSLNIFLSQEGENDSPILDIERTKKMAKKVSLAVDMGITVKTTSGKVWHVSVSSSLLVDRPITEKSQKKKPAVETARISNSLPLWPLNV